MKKQQHCFHTSLSDLQYHAFFLFPKTVIILRSVRHFSIWIYIIAKYIIFDDHQWNINIKHRIVSVKHQTVHPGWKNYLMLVCSISFNSVTHIELKAQIQIKQNVHFLLSSPSWRAEKVTSTWFLCINSTSCRIACSLYFRAISRWFPSI